MKLSNKFTLSRIILAPVFFLLYFIPIWTGKFNSLSIFIMFPLLAFMEFTDYLDGHYARKFNEVSDFGKLFDPFADVVVHLSTFVCFMFSVNGIGYMPTVVFVFILYRELTMNFIRMIAVKKGVAIAARKGGKLKTVVYVISGFFALLLEALVRLNVVVEFFGVLRIISICLFVLCLILSYISFIDYLIHFSKLLKD
ncbi:MAG: CDP-diacylglycerol--glycerol-3-phosphate 3-phosphatidyltransferase [Treponema sp.]|jgi:CDP-diacylglycerol---glycerol-3-phosphate 3-phosphatidyltransferase|nr:CDP-diacylglycerol--glycerol-3-phosphate 3-phosphatidyltransferase [Treponema sp.]